MRRSFIIILLVVLTGLARGQKSDYVWLTGYSSNGATYDSTCQCYFGISKFDFNESPVSITYDSLGINYSGTSSTICDSTGNLLFYSNGVQVRNAHDEIMPHGDSLGFGPLFTYLNTSLLNYGNVFPQGLITLPNPLLENVYDLFYPYIDTTDGQVLPDKILRARVDMNANGGMGAVTQKDVVVWTGDNDITISAVKHGNGRDWWLCTNQTSGNCHVMMLYTGSDTITTSMQCIGAVSPFGDSHACRFSTDGNFYVTTNDSGQVSVFNFDRCTGVLGLREEFTVPEISDTSSWTPSGVEFSPDSRFFYVFCSEFVIQFDLTADTIINSKDIIATYHYPGHYPADYYWGQLAPDGKIYISGGSSSFYIGAIDSPDMQGSECGFQDQTLHLPSIIYGFVYNPNYRLGALTQSQCDSLSSATQDIRDTKEQILKVFPNPANDVTTVDYGFTDWNKGPVSLQITNQLGQVVYTQALPMYSGFQRVNTSAFSAGTYTVFIKRSNGVVAAGELVVVH